MELEDKLIGMKRTIFIVTLFFAFKAINAQRIFGIDEEFGLLHINEKTKVRIETKYLSPPSYAGMGGVQEFVVLNDTIKSRSYNYGEAIRKDEGYSAFYEQYPFLIKIRNNDFSIVNNPNDSLVYDDKGRIKEEFGLQLGDKSGKLYSRFKYLNDTTIFEIAITYLNINSSCYLYELDSKHNLKSVKESTIGTKQAINDSVDYIKADFWKQTQFNYNKSRSRIENIKTFVLENKNRIPQTTQFFIYKNGRPVSSYVRDEKTKKITYRQTYKYTTIK
jgi:hypothetical protein